MLANLEKQILEGIAPFYKELWMLQILQSSVGCANSCEMCSQWASPWVTRITRDSLSRVFWGLKMLLEGGIWEWSSLGENRTHKPWIIFPYLDTDVGSDPNLGYMIETLWRDFQCKTRISTVGFSRHNTELQEMHTDIASRIREFVEGFRISLTPYTAYFFSDDYPMDIANLINTYLPIIESQWVGRDVFACELRFPPFIQLGDVEVWAFWDRFYIRSGDYCFIADNAGSIPQNKIIHIENKKVQFDEQGITWKIYSWDGFSTREITEIIETELFNVAQIYHVKNVDWDVFAVNPFPLETRWFHAVHFLPKTTTRKQSGIIDSTRPFMNAMVAYKKWKGFDWKWKIDHGNIGEFLDFFIKHIQAGTTLTILRDFWMERIYPIITVAANIIKSSDIADDAFFDPKFLVDTWHIVNQGRAKHIFKGLVSQTDEPITVNEMKWYADENSIGTSRGVVYRLAPIPMNSGGLRNLIRWKSGLVLSGLSHKWLQPIPEKTHFIPADIETTFTPRQKILEEFGIPWLPLTS